jgi:hypothetical protein
MVTRPRFPLRLMAKHLYTIEKQKINLFNNIFQDIYIYICDRTTSEIRGSSSRIRIR